MGTTLSFCFRYKSDWYGLTTGHFFNLGESIYVATGRILKRGFEIERIGHGVSLSRETDSLVFIIDAEWVQLYVRDRIFDPKSGLLRPLRMPKKDSPPTMGSVLLGFGSQSRGALGHVTTTNLPQELAGDAMVGDIGITGYNPQEELPVMGDCGCVHFDSYGVGVSMHHVLRHYHEDDEYESFGVPLHRVMASHEQLSRTPLAPILSRFRRFIDKKQAHASGSEARRKFIDYRGVGHFDVQIVRRTLDTMQASSGARKFVDRRGMGHFNVQIGSRFLEAKQAN